MAKRIRDLADGEVLKLNVEEGFVVHKDGDKDEDYTIGGWFTTEKLNSYNTIVKADGIDLSEFDGQAFFMHDRYTFPVGKALKTTIQRKKVPGTDYYGTWGEVVVFKEAPPLLHRGIREGVLDGFSIGFRPTKEEYDKETDIITFTKWKLSEISIVTKGANDESRFKVIHSFEEDLKENGYEEYVEKVKQRLELEDEESNKDSNKNKNTLKGRKVSLMADTYVQFDDFESLKAKQEENVTKLGRMQSEIQEKLKELEDDRITKSEFKLRMEKMSDEFEKIMKDIQTVKNIQEVEKDRWVFDDYRSIISSYKWLTDEGTGKPMAEVHQKAYALFQLPIDYKTINHGQELKNLRNLHDAVLFVDAVLRYRAAQRGGVGYNITKLGLFQELQKQTERFDKDIAHAMSTTATGYGTEWVPQEMSAEFNELLRKMPMLPSMFPTWMMPKGSSAYFPFQNGKAVVYRGVEATTNNPSEARKTNIATSRKLFTPDIFIGALVSSEELDEDSIVDMVEFIRSELATALLEGLESTLINGDDTATHFDNTGTTRYQTYNVETSFKGLRRLGVDATVIDIENVNSGTATGVGALDTTAMVNVKESMGLAGLRSGECVWITGVKGKGQILNALYDAGVYGTVNTITTGELPTIDGSPVYLSAYFPEDLQSTGIYHAATDVKHTAVVCAHKPSFRIGQRRGITLEFNKNILTQQQQFVASARWDFGKICADEIIPVKYGVNIQHTA